MDELIKKLGDYGTDIEGAMERFIEDEELYISCFKEFLKDETFAQLNTAVKEKDYSVIIDAAHTLKGVAGNLGLKPIFNALSELVLDMRNEKYGEIENTYKKIDEEYQKIYSLI